MPQLRLRPQPQAHGASPSPRARRKRRLAKLRRGWQARNFEERISYANNVSTEDTFDEVLADELQPAADAEPTALARRLEAPSARGGRNNEMWCLWGPAPNAAWLIAANGTVLLAQTWFDADEMNATLRRL